MGGSDHPLPLNGHEILVQVRYIVWRGQGEFLVPRTGSAYGAHLGAICARRTVRWVGAAIKPQQIEGGIAEMDDAFVVFEHKPGLAHHPKR